MLRPIVGTRFQVLFHSPARGAFHLSLTVLIAIGISLVFSLSAWSRMIQTGFLVSRPTQDSDHHDILARTGLSPAMAGLSRPVPLRTTRLPSVLLPRGRRNDPGLGSSLFARRYSGNRLLFLLLRLLRCFSSAGLPTFVSRGCPIRTPARRNGHLRLHADFRSLSRPSSPARS